MTAKIKKILSVALVLLMVFTSVPLQGLVGLELPGLFSTKASALETSGKCGENVTYTYNEETSEIFSESTELSIKSGETITVEIESEKITYIKFIPMASGTYTFISISDGDTYGYLCDADKNEIAYNDDGNGSDFSITYELEAGKTYYWGARYYSSSQSGSFDVKLTCDKVVCAHENTTEHARQESTCTENGYTAGVFCEDCQTWISGHEVILKHHTDEDGNKICDICGGEYKNIIKSGNCGKSIYDEYGCVVGYSDNVIYELYENGELVISGTGEMGDFWKDDYVIPPYGTYYAGDNEYEDSVDNNVKKVIFEDGVTSIGQEAFRYFTALESVTIPDSVTSIGEEAFYGCSSLTSITIPDSVTNISNRMFENCNSLISIIIGNGVISIGYRAFSWCYSLTSLTIGKSVETIYNEAFYGCDSLTNVTIPDSVKIISNYAFSDCDNLTSVEIGKSVSDIGESVFENCNNLTAINVNSSNTAYESENGVLFAKGKGVLLCYPAGKTDAEYIVPAEVINISINAFCKTEKLKRVIIGKNVESIGEFAFWSSNVNVVRIPESVTSIGYGAFCDCYIERVYFSGTQEQWDTISISDSNEAITDTVIIFNSLIGYYDASGKCGENVTYAYNSKTGEVVISGTGAMYDYGAYDPISPFRNSDIKSIVIENGVTSIGDYAFSDCYDLISVTIPDSVTSIGDSAFSYCDSLKSVTIPDSVISIGWDAFDGTAWYNDQSDGDVYIGKFYYRYKGKMPNNTNVVIRNGTKGIADYAFGDCYGLTSVTIPNSVTNIGDSAFTYCHALEKVIIPDSVITIGNSAFSSCGSLTSLTIGKNVESIGDYAFANCSNLNNLIIGNSVKSIGVCAFLWCNSLTSITIPDSVTSIGKSAFLRCGSLISVTIPNSVKTIAESAFGNCDSLKDVYYLGTSSQWKAISIGSKNECLTNATIHYNYSPFVLGKTTKLTATQTTSAVTLKWNKVPNATGYKIYQKTSKGWQSLGNVTTTSKTVSGLTAGTKYTFAVKAGAVVDGKVIWSDVYTAINTATKAVKPAKVTSAQNDNAIKLTWTKSTGATGYRIYYRTSTKADWKVGKSTTTATSHTFSNLKPNQAFQFAVRPYITTDSGVVWSDYTTITASTTPAVPVAKVTSPSKGKVTLTWNAVSGATGYQVYYKSGNGSWKLYKTVAKPATYNFKNLKSGTKYTFAVRAYRTVEMTNFRSGYKAVSVTVK